MPRFKTGDFAVLTDMYTVKHGDCLFYTIKRGQVVRIVGDAYRYSADYVRAQPYPRPRGYGSEISIPIDYLRKLRVLELLALQAVE